MYTATGANFSEHLSSSNTSNPATNNWTMTSDVRASNMNISAYSIAIDFCKWRLFTDWNRFSIKISVIRKFGLFANKRRRNKLKKWTDYNSSSPAWPLRCWWAGAVAPRLRDFGSEMIICIGDNWFLLLCSIRRNVSRKRPEEE